jgi:hypothetical protein
LDNVPGTITVQASEEKSRRSIVPVVDGKEQATIMVAKWNALSTIPRAPGYAIDPITAPGILEKTHKKRIALHYLEKMMTISSSLPAKDAFPPDLTETSRLLAETL